jgi:hypothetical protein
MSAPIKEPSNVNRMSKKCLPYHHPIGVQETDPGAAGKFLELGALPVGGGEHLFYVASFILNDPPCRS